MSIEAWQYQPGLLPRMLVPLVGVKVDRAWIARTTGAPHGMLIVRFENRRVLKVSASEVCEQRALEMMVGTDVDVDWSALNQLGQPPQVPALVGRRFTGMDADVLMFGSVGARITLRGVSWVREK